MNTRRKFLNTMARKSAELQTLLVVMGFTDDGMHTNRKGCELVSRLAREQSIRDWPYTRTIADYDRLIAAVRASRPSRPSVKSS